MTDGEWLLLALLLVFGLPWLIWRLGRTDAWAPLVVVQIVGGILLGPGLLGALLPELHQQLFTPTVVQALGGLATWAVLLFVWLAGIELDLPEAWRQRRETSLTAALALLLPMVTGAAAAVLLQGLHPGWQGPAAASWQFIAGIGMACTVTALPILVLFMARLGILRQPLGQRVLRYASLDDIAIWAILALILLDWQRAGRQLAFLGAFLIIAWAMRRWMPRLSLADRWHVALLWLLACALAADWSGLHYMVGAFLAGVACERSWFNPAQGSTGPATQQVPAPAPAAPPQACALEKLREHVLLLLMPVFFLSTGLRTEWTLGGPLVFLAAGLLLLAALGGKLAATHLAGRLLGWKPGEASLIGWLLQTKALIMILFANVLLDRQIISADAFTALLLMAVASTMLTIPMVSRRLPPGGG